MEHFLTSEVTYMLIGVNVAVFVMEAVIGPYLFFYNFSLIPILLMAGRNAYTLLMSIYLHADLLHLLSNMFALWIFGPECERRVGSRNFLIIYNVAGLAGNALHVLAYPESPAPAMGASGAIFGIIAAFAVFFPLRMIFIIWFIPMALPAVVWAAIYFLFEVFYEFSGLNPFVAHMAHIGGFIVGLAFALIYRRVSRRSRGRDVKIVWVEG